MNIVPRLDSGRGVMRFFGMVVWWYGGTTTLLHMVQKNNLSRCECTKVVLVPLQYYTIRLAVEQSSF